MSFHDRFTGVFPALVTPLDADGGLDRSAVGRLVRFLVDGGVGGIWAMGSGGEFASFDPATRAELIRLAAEAANGRVPVIAGVSDPCIAQVHRHVAAAREGGADAVFATTPYYYGLLTDEVVRFYLELADRSPLPVVVYHNPFNAKGRLDVAAVRRLADHGNIAGLKDSSCDMGLFQALLDAVGGRKDFRLFQGHDPLMVPSALMGADGAVVAAAGIAPRLVSALFRAARGGDMATVGRLNRQYRALDAIFAIDGNATDANFLAGQKAALEVLGLCTRRPAPPFAPLPEMRIGAIREVLARVGLLHGEGGESSIAGEGVTR